GHTVSRPNSRLSPMPFPSPLPFSRQRSPRPLCLLGNPPLELGDMLEAPLPVVFDVNHHPPRHTILAADNAIHDVLEGVERLAPSADEQAAAVAAHRELNAPGVRPGPRFDDA